MNPFELFHTKVRKSAWIRRRPRRMIVFLLCGAAFTVLVGSCQQEDERVARLAHRAQSLQDSLSRLADHANALEAENQTKQQQLAEASKLVSSTLSRLSEIARRENILRERMSKTLIAAGRIEGQPGAKEVRVTMNEYISGIEKRLAESRDIINKLEAENRRLVPLDSTVSELRAMLNQREKTLVNLRERVDTLVARLSRAEEQNEELTSENKELTVRNEELGQAYVAVAIKDSLEEWGIVRKPFLRRTRIHKLDPAKFTAINVNTSRIGLPANREEAKVFSPHKHEPSLYRVRQDTLLIEDPDEFWEISRFLIVEIKK